MFKAIPIYIKFELYKAY